MMRVVRLLVALGILVALVACKTKTTDAPIELGAHCSVAEKDFACAAGKLAICRDGTWQETLTCSGSQACHRIPTKPGETAAVCDGSLGREGNPCAEVDTVCSEDRRARLTCTGGRWRVQARCDQKPCAYSTRGALCE